MANQILGEKVGMTQIYTEQGQVVPVTVIQAGPCPVIQVKTVDSDGYDAIQVGFGKKKAKSFTRPERVRFEKVGVEPTRWLREFRTEEAGSFEPGQSITVEQFTETKKVDVTGTTKGRGFAGTIKRHGFSSGPKSHGSMNVRRPGSIGCSATPARVIKGKKMPGHYGNETVTIQGLELVHIDADKNLLFVKGGIPGANGGLVTVKASNRN